MDEQSDALKEYVKRLEAEHRTFYDVVRRQNEEKNSKEKDNPET